MRCPARSPAAHAQAASARPDARSLREVDTIWVDSNVCTADIEDRLRDRAADVARLIAGDTWIYVCGVKGMEAGVEAALADACAAHGLDWAQLRARFMEEGRLQVETY